MLNKKEHIKQHGVRSYWRAQAKIHAGNSTIIKSDITKAILKGMAAAFESCADDLDEYDIALVYHGEDDDSRPNIPGDLPAVQE